MLIKLCKRSAIHFEFDKRRIDNGTSFAVGSSWMRLCSSDQMNCEGSSLVMVLISLAGIVC
jgi:hypothetical protein